MTGENPTLGRKLGMTEHLSLLLRKARKLGLGPAELQSLAIARGCSYYADGSPPFSRPIMQSDFSDAELAIALLHPGLSYHPQNIRLGAAMLGSRRNATAEVAWLAKLERCEPVVRAVAEAGLGYEPENSFWSELLSILPAGKAPRPGVLPHRTRFVAMTGYTRRGRETVSDWIRPANP